MRGFDKLFENNCVIDVNEWLDKQRNVMHRMKQKDTDEIYRMYPNLNDLKNKLFLFLDFEYCIRENVFTRSAHIKIELTDGSLYDLPKYVANTPFPNKCWYRVNMKNGRKVSKRGIILVFNSFDELSQIKRIKCLWEFIVTNYNNFTGTKDIQAEIVYNLSFEESDDVNNNIYTLLSYDGFLHENWQQKQKQGDRWTGEKYKQIYYDNNELSCSVVFEADMIIKPYDVSLIPSYK